MIAESPRTRFHYGWVVVAVTFVAMLVASGIRSAPGVMIVPLETEFGWDRASVSLAVSINLLLFGLGGPFAAAFAERFGIGRLAAGSLLMIAVAVGLTTQMRAIWQLQLLWGLTVGIGIASMGSWLAAAVSNQWFVERRGLVVGMLTAANATGQLLFLPMLASLIVAFGWRMAAVFISGAALLVVPLMLFIFRERPQDVGLRPYGAAEEVIPKVEGSPTTGNPFASAVGTLRECLRSRDFLLLAWVFSTCGATTIGMIGTHMIPASIENGMPEVMAAGLLSVMGIFNLFGTMMSGWLTDRFDSRWLLAWYLGVRGLSLLFLPHAYEAGFPTMGLFVVFYGLDWMATGPPAVRISAGILGKKKAAMVYAWVQVAHLMGAATLAYVAGVLHNWLGDYRVSFVVSGVLCLVAVIAVSKIRHSTVAEPRPELPAFTETA